MFKSGDIINYGLYASIKVVGEDEKHYILEDRNGHQKKIYKELVDKYGEKIKN